MFNKIKAMLLSFSEEGFFGRVRFLEGLLARASD